MDTTLVTLARQREAAVRRSATTHHQPVDARPVRRRTASRLRRIADALDADGL